MAVGKDVLGRLQLVPSLEDKPDLCILAPYVNRLLEQARPEAMLQALGLVTPGTAVRVTYKGNPHLADIVKDTSQFRLPLPPCTCGMPGGGHLCTTSVDWIPDCFDDVKRMLLKGLNHVPCAPLDTQAVADLHASIACAVGGPCYGDSAREWVHQTLAPAHIPDVDGVQLSRTHPGIKYIMSKCFVGCVDKAANQPMFICKHYALTMVYTHCLNNPACELLECSPNPAVIQQRLHDLVPWLPKDTTSGPSGKLATMYPVVKVHKTPVGWRMITSAVGTILHDPAVLLQATTSCLLEELKHVCALFNKQLKHFRQCHVQMYPLIPDGRVCLLNVNPRLKYLCDFSADVDKCFDMIPHAQLLESMHSTVRLLVSAYAKAHKGKQPHFVVSCKLDNGHAKVTNVSWTHKADTPAQHVLTVDTWLQLCEYTLQHCFVQVAGSFFRVVSGIPQGLHCSPDWCNLFLLHHEIKFVRAYPAEAHDILSLWFRQVDDVRVVVAATSHNLARNMSCAQWHKHLQELLGRIYPAPLSLSPTCELCPDIESSVLCRTGFLDINTSLLQDGTLHVCLIRKEKKLPIQVCQYVHLESNRPVHLCYNVIIGLVMSAIWHNTARDPCLQDIACICNKFICNGHARSRVLRVVSKCLDKDYSYLSLEYNPGALMPALRPFVH